VSRLAAAWRTGTQPLDRRYIVDALVAESRTQRWSELAGRSLAVFQRLGNPFAKQNRVACGS
jgi:hypothetical protein